MQLDATQLKRDLLNIGQIAKAKKNKSKENWKIVYCVAQCLICFIDTTHKKELEYFENKNTTKCNRAQDSDAPTKMYTIVAVLYKQYFSPGIKENALKRNDAALSQ